MTQTLRIGLAQINSTLGDFIRNQEKIKNYMLRAKQAGMDLVIFPELALCGYPPEDLLLRSDFLAANQQALAALALETQDMTAVVGFAHAADGKVYNAAAVLQDGKLAGIYQKIELPNYGVFDEKRYFSPGTRPLVLTCRGARLAITICEDIWVERGPAETFVHAQNITAVINLSASPFHAGKADERLALISNLAKRAQVFVAYANLIGGQDELIFDGGSLVVSPDGGLLAQAAHFEEALLEAELPILNPGLPGGQVYIQDVGCQSSALPGSKPLQPQQVPVPSWVEQIYLALRLGTRDYVVKNNFSRVVLGLSGGIDSALTAAIAVDALGRENVTGVTMPSVITSDETLADAKQLAANLGIELIVLPIQPILSGYETSLREAFANGTPGLEHENLQARIRGNLLMALSNRFGWLVLTTGNKSETAVGYCTLYGDMAGGFAMLKDVPKTTVYQLADYINHTAGHDLIPASTLLRPPTAELRPNQKDQDSLPPYPVLDEIIRAYVEEDKDPEAILAAGLDASMVAKTIRLIDGSEYKRRQAPPGIKLTPKAFGRDRRMPLTNRFGQLRNLKS